MKLPRHAEIWLPPYVADRTRSFFGGGSSAIRHVWLTVADHFEPFWNHGDTETALRRVQAWRKRWPEIAADAIRDHGNAPPRYTFFYPVEQYHPEILDSLAEMTEEGIADVEVHLHHDGERREDFIDRIRKFCDCLIERHGLLRRVDGRSRFGFIHGNWALDNSLPNGRWCGLNDEITLLRDLGCYADFTMPSGASPTQAHTLNSVYWCTDDPCEPKSYDRGVPVRAGEKTSGDLLMIPGPLGLRWKGRVLPRLETGEIAAYDPPTTYRARRWFDLAPRIGEHAFLKLYTHGATESNRELLLGEGLRDLYQVARAEAERRGACIHFVSAWQMYLAIEAINLGQDPLGKDPIGHIPLGSEPRGRLLAVMSFKPKLCSSEPVAV
jgi:hypothetical protein